MHYKVIYTECLDDNEGILKAESWEYVDKADAIALFNERFNKMTSSMLNDYSLCKCKMVKEGYRAFIKIQGVHCCLAVVDDMNNIVKI